MGPALSDANSLVSGIGNPPPITDGSKAGDWRLPNVKELLSLVDYGRFNPALPAGHPFTNVQTDYWSSNHDQSGSPNAWAVDIFAGGVDI